MLPTCYHTQLSALKEPSDSKEALPLKDVWRSATAMSGAQCVMISGGLLMLKLHADSWDSQPLVRTFPSLFCHLVTMIQWEGEG